MANKKKAAAVELRGTVSKELPVLIDQKACRKKEGQVVSLELKVAKLTASMAPAKSEIKKLNKEIDKLCIQVEQSVELRDVKCEVIYDFEHRTVNFRRLDTKQIVKELSRTMTDSDREGDLFAEPKKGKRGRPPKEPKGGIVRGKAGAALRLANPVLTPGEAVSAARAHAAGYDDAPADDTTTAEA